MATKAPGRITVQAVTPSHALYEGNVDEVIVKSGSGLMTILPDHQAVLLDMTVAPLVLKEPSGEEKVFVIDSGFLEFKENLLTILVDAGHQVEHREEANSICGTAI